MYRLHVTSLPHTYVSKTFSHCAYTIKIYNFCKMMMDQGHEVYLYAGEKSDAPCTELINVVPEETRRANYAHDGTGIEFPSIVFDATLVPWREMNARTISEMEKRIQPRDFIVMATGLSHKCVMEAFPKNISFEAFVGYSGTCAPFIIYESYAWLHYLAGCQGRQDVHWYNWVVNVYHDKDDFPMGQHKGDYILLLGRLIQRKGLSVASDICKRAGKKLVIAGQGCNYYEPGKCLKSSNEITLEGDHFEYVGVVGVEERKKLLGNAAALIMPTLYCGPGENSHVEAMMMGTPVITSPWGCFTETVQDGKTGFRVNTIQEGVWAVNNLDKLNKNYIREYALSRWTLEVIGPQFNKCMNQMYGLHTGGFYTDDFVPFSRGDINV